MKLGVVYPQIELGGNPHALRRFTQAAEALGYEHIVMYDHVVGCSEGSFAEVGDPYSERDPFHDPMTAFAYLAGLTDTIEFITGILILPQRQTVLVAKQAADIDLMSAGRLRLGVGAGYNPVEYEALGIDFSTRGRRLDEQIPYLRRLWSEERISFQGEFHQMNRASIVPRPVRQIPIWCGGFSKAAFRRAAHLADGFIFGYGLAPAAMGHWEMVQHYLHNAGRQIADFGAHFLIHPPTQPYDDAYLVAGLSRLRTAGATDASLFTMSRGFTQVEEHIEYLAHLRECFRQAGLVEDRGAVVNSATTKTICGQ